MPPENDVRKSRWQLEITGDAIRPHSRARRAASRGRKASIDPEKVKALKAQGMGPSAIAKALKIGRASVYRALEN